MSITNWPRVAPRLTALQGAQVLIYPTAIGWHPREKAQFGVAQHQAWETIQRAHAIANGVYVAAVNRVGHEGLPDAGLDFWGASFVSDPFGAVLKRASHDCEEVLVVECDIVGASAAAGPGGLMHILVGVDLAVTLFIGAIVGDADRRREAGRGVDADNRPIEIGGATV